MSRSPRTRVFARLRSEPVRHRGEFVRQRLLRDAGLATRAAQPAARAAAAPRKREPITIDGTLVAASTAEGAGLAIGTRVFHQKFGYGRVAQVDGNKLTVDFDKAGQKKVVDSFVERV